MRVADKQEALYEPNVHPKNLQPTPLFIHPSSVRHPGRPNVNPLVWSNMFEHMCRCVYGGAVDDPKDPADSDLLIPQAGGRLGWRKDVAKHLSHGGELQTPMMRWPGGNFVSNYHWQDAIGPIEDRKVMRELAWDTEEPNIFGTDEFMAWCREMKIEPYLCLNMGSGTLEEALAWIDYCNGTGNTYWANLRRKNTGRKEPHNVRYWGLGNEMWNNQQVGHRTAAGYAQEALRWADAIRRYDSELKLVACGWTGSDRWDHEVIGVLSSVVDFHSIHYYSSVDTPAYRFEKTVFGPACAEKNIQVCKSLIDLQSINRSYTNKPVRDIRICFDEWNCNDRTHRSPEERESRELDYTFAETLGFVAWCNILTRQSDSCPIACLAQAVNVLSPLRTRKDGLLLLPIYYPFRLFSRYMKNGQLLSLAPHPDTYTGPTYPAFIQQTDMRPDYIDTSALIVRSTTQAGEASIRLSVLNRHPEASWTGGLCLEGFDVRNVEVHEMYSDDLEATNSFEKPETVKPIVKHLTAKQWADLAPTYLIKKHSWSFFIIDGKLQ